MDVEVLVHDKLADGSHLKSKHRVGHAKANIPVPSYHAVVIRQQLLLLEQLDVPECLGRKPLFPGDDYIHQLQLINDKLGSPAEADMQFIKSVKARRFMTNLPAREKIPWAQLYPKANPQALDLLDKLLIFDPAKRVTVDEALRHEYLESLHCPEDEPSAE